MAFNINSFRSNALSFDGARPTLFQILVNFPTLATNGTTVTNKLAFSAQSTSLPGWSMGVVEVPYMGRSIKLDGNPTFDDWSFEVLNDNDFVVRAAFETWMNGMNTIISNRKDPSFAGLSYKSTATVYQLSQESSSNGVEDAIKAYTFSGAFPRLLAPIALNWASTNSVETFGVTLACDYWVPGADENYTNSGGFNGLNGAAQNWSPKLGSDTNN